MGIVSGKRDQTEFPIDLSTRNYRYVARLLDLLITRMHPHVPRQAAGLGEGRAARLADMRLLPRMRAHVRNQVAGRCERLAARLTDMRLLPRMRAHVPIQAAGL